MAVFKKILLFLLEFWLFLFMFRFVTIILVGDRLVILVNSRYLTYKFLHYNFP